MMLRNVFKPMMAGVAALALGWAGPALAWGEVGHRTVADIAQANVSPATRAQIATLLAAEKGLGTPQCAVKSLADAAVWPDCLRGEAWRWSYTFPWHYQDGEVDAPAFDIKANCSYAACVTGQIERTRRELADSSLPAAQRLLALAFLVHFVGDLHQPLHAAEHDHDAGGNGVKVLRPGETKPDSLHWIWDKDVAEAAVALPGPPLVRAYSADERAAIATGTVEDWAKESWIIARDKVYPQVYGHRAGPADHAREPIAFTSAMLAADAPIGRERLRQAGLRLAKMLDAALGQ
ncbi:MAG TPA: S1/P1 nuclease [Novosphingobium sp.]|nr:S1/P1 nuclease [Novosphingobium sp.]